jgi:hypothetical protein
MVPILFSVVSPALISKFCEQFWYEHQEVCHDYTWSQAEREVHSLIEGCSRSYPDTWLPPPEADVYKRLPDETHRAAFRIFRSLAFCESDASTPPPNFFLSMDGLATRLDSWPMAASAILRFFEKEGIIAVVRKGQVRMKGHRPRATTYKWLLASPASSCDNTSEAGDPALGPPTPAEV